ncbi:hypothetical protein [Streptomyces sp. NPDC003480]
MTRLGPAFSPYLISEESEDCPMATAREIMTEGAECIGAQETVLDAAK